MSRYSNDEYVAARQVLLHLESEMSQSYHNLKTLVTTFYADKGIPEPTTYTDRCLDLEIRLNIFVSIFATENTTDYDSMFFRETIRERAGWLLSHVESVHRELEDNQVFVDHIDNLELYHVWASSDDALNDRHAATSKSKLSAIPIMDAD